MKKRGFINQAGFTLIEILAVVTIIGMLVTIVAYNVLGRIDSARRTTAKTQIRSIEGALSLYKLDTGVYPSTEQSLKALVEKPTVGFIPNSWREGGYIKSIPKDPWKNEYIYLSPGSNNRDYEVISYGADGEPGGEGNNADINSWDMEEKE